MTIYLQVSGDTIAIAALILSVLVFGYQIGWQRHESKAKEPRQVRSRQR